MFTRLQILLFSALILVTNPVISAVQANYKVENIKDNVYRFTVGHYHSAFMIVDNLALVTDPINSDAAKYLKRYIKKTFNADIKYMLYSHSHVDHAMGGNKLIDTNTNVVAHQFAAEDLKLNKVPTALPDLTFTDTLKVDLGDSYVQLNYYGPNNGRGNVSMRFMPANVLYVVDWIVLGRMPYTAVRDGMLKGKNLATLQKEISLPQYSHLKMYQQWLPLNIEGVYNNLVEMGYFNFRSDIDAQF